MDFNRLCVDHQGLPELPLCRIGITALASHTPSLCRASKWLGHIFKIFLYAARTSARCPCRWYVVAIGEQKADVVTLPIGGVWRRAEARLPLRNHPSVSFCPAVSSGPGVAYNRSFGGRAQPRRESLRNYKPCFPQGRDGRESRRRTAQPFVILSISAMSSALSSHETAFTFCSTCSTRVAPAITLDTCGRAASQENASSSMV